MMDDIEKDLERLDLAPPPPWAKARALVAAQNVLRRQARRSRLKCITVAVVAASVAVVVVGTYIADAIAPILNRSGPSFRYPPPESVDTMGPGQPEFVPAPDRRRSGKRGESPKETEKKKEDTDEEEDKEKEKEDEDESTGVAGQGEG